MKEMLQLGLWGKEKEKDSFVFGVGWFFFLLSIENANALKALLNCLRDSGFSSV